MRVAGGITLGLGLAATGLIVAGLVGAIAGSTSGYVCFGVVAAAFCLAGVAMLAGSGTIPDDWPPRDD